MSSMTDITGYSEMWLLRSTSFSVFIVSGVNPIGSIDVSGNHSMAYFIYLIAMRTY